MENQKLPTDTAGNTYNRNLLVLVLMVGSFCTILNSTLMNTAFPAIMKDFNITTATVQWLTTGFMMINGVMIPISAWLINRFSSANYHVAYGTSGSPLGHITVADPCTVLIQDHDRKIYGPAHNSVVNLPGTDEWRIVYHRINENHLDKEPGIHREVCVDRMEFNPDGTIKPVTPTK